MMTEADYQAKLTELKSILKEFKKRYNADFLVSISIPLNEEQYACVNILDGSPRKVAEILYDLVEDTPQVLPSLIIAAKAAEKRLKQ